MSATCREAIRFLRQPARTLRCGKPTTHRVIATGPTGEQIDHGQRCERHAADLARSFAPRPGWRVAVAAINPTP